MPERPPRTTQSIRRYYEQNTRLFFALGSSPAAYSIHRALWMEGIETQDDALNASNRLLLAAAQGINASGCLRLLDLGCGIGGTLFYLLERLPKPALGVGLTISPIQARLAWRRAGQLGLDRSCLFVEADFLAPPLPVGFDLVYSVEAFVHAVDPQRYLAQAARLLYPGGRLILIDDFLAQSPVPEQQQPARAPLAGSLPSRLAYAQFVRACPGGRPGAEPGTSPHPGDRPDSAPAPARFARCACLCFAQPGRAAACPACHLAQHVGEHGIAAVLNARLDQLPAALFRERGVMISLPVASWLK